MGGGGGGERGAGSLGKARSVEGQLRTWGTPPGAGREGGGELGEGRPLGAGQKGRGSRRRGCRN